VASNQRGVGALIERLFAFRDRDIFERPVVEDGTEGAPGASVHADAQQQRLAGGRFAVIRAPMICRPIPHW